MGPENSREDLQVFEIEMNFFFHALFEGGEDCFFTCPVDMTLFRGDIPLHTIAFYIICFLLWSLSNIFISFDTQEHY